MPKGLYDKFRVTRTDGKPHKSNSDFFPLNIGTDPHARVALRAYAVSVDIDNPQLAKDITVWLDDLDTPDRD